MISPQFSKRYWWWRIAVIQILSLTSEVTYAAINYGFVWNSAAADLFKTFITVGRQTTCFVLRFCSCFFDRWFVLSAVTGPLNEIQIAYMCKETLQGLAYLHTMGKMHRDIKVDSLNAYCLPFHRTVLNLTIVFTGSEYSPNGFWRR